MHSYTVCAQPNTQTSLLWVAKSTLISWVCSLATVVSQLCSGADIQSGQKLCPPLKRHKHRLPNDVQLFHSLKHLASDLDFQSIFKQIEFREHNIWIACQSSHWFALISSKTFVSMKLQLLKTINVENYHHFIVWNPRVDNLSQTLQMSRNFINK